MKLAISSAFVLALAAGSAHASPEPWCGGGVADTFNVSMGNKFVYNSDADDLADQMSLMNIVGASCNTMGHDNERFHAELAAARARWAKRLHMSDADWADAAEWIREPQSMRYDRELDPPEHKAYTELGPVAQFALLTQIEPDAPGNLAYQADVFGTHLSQAGRVGYVRTCLGASDSAIWPMCLADIAAIDLDKLADELRADKSASGTDRMFVRYAAWNLVTTIAPGRRADLAKLDPAYGKLAEVAAKASQSWTANADSLALAAALDDAVAKRSRSLHVDGCAAKARAELNAALADVPANVFDDMPMLPPKGDHKFEIPAKKVLDAIAARPDGYLAELAVVLCAIDSDQPSELSAAAKKAIAGRPGFRGPHTAALTAMRHSKIELDARDQHLALPVTRHAWQVGIRTEEQWSQGVIKKLSRKGERVHVEYTGRNVTSTFCDDWRDTNHATAIRDDGTIEYQRVCTAMKTETHFSAPAPIDLDAIDAAALAPGMTLTVHDGVVIAWKNATDMKPVVVLGIAVKR
jgi:hypothetical protein